MINYLKYERSIHTLQHVGGRGWPASSWRGFVTGTSCCHGNQHSLGRAAGTQTARAASSHPCSPRIQASHDTAWRKCRCNPWQGQTAGRSRRSPDGPTSRHNACHLVENKLTIWVNFLGCDQNILKFYFDLMIWISENTFSDFIKSIHYWKSYIHMLYH